MKKQGNDTKSISLKCFGKQRQMSAAIEKTLGKSPVEAPSGSPKTGHIQFPAKNTRSGWVLTSKQVGHSPLPEDHQGDRTTNEEGGERGDLTINFDTTPLAPKKNKAITNGKGAQTGQPYKPQKTMAVKLRWRWNEFRNQWNRIPPTIIAERINPQEGNWLAINPQIRPYWKQQQKLKRIITEINELVFQIKISIYLTTTVIDST